MAIDRFVFVGAAALLAAACGGGEEAAPAESETAAIEAAPSPSDMLDAAIAGDQRGDEERARDVFRNPKETIEFFEIEPDMTVVEVFPGGGWYTQVLAPYLKQGGGKLYAAGPAREGGSERLQASLDRYQSFYVERPEIYGDIEMTDAPDAMAPAGAADVVVTFRNVHSFMSRESTEAFFTGFYEALKPGGVLGVVEHRADGSELPRDGSSGYVYTDDVIAFAEAAGFNFEAASEINANAADTKDHPFGVWTLPPARRSSAIRGEENEDFDRAPFDAIGESDRMTLKFRKPIAADGALLE
ncbi:MAG: hypothetical protein AAFW81_00110 [Pseudomonadota bacterium]